MDKIDRREEKLISIISCRRARLHHIRKVVVEEVSALFESGATWGRWIIASFASFDGKLAGVRSANGGAIMERSATVQLFNRT
ncbi:hypothetical protein FIBSPDRAFT_870664 [Athelia psychrophila]|uniref:Uncharacterized protein n=1 Tax=Athelia psychrophila TaxID=1759441 RepID=A0A166AWU4_9AGAM|nr:hypothetical protein FIBSPDRAFT_870664 [Fibularhizoctonia sp. CBS 109695]